MLLGISILFAVSLLFYFFPPKKINDLYGYRTIASKKSESNWKLANSYSAKIWLYFSVPSFFLALLANYKGWLNLEMLFAGINLLGLVVAIVMTEIKLRKN